MNNQPATFAVVEHYELRESPRRETLALRVEAQRLIVLAPKRARQRDIQHFIAQNQLWIEKQIGLQQAREQAIAHKQFAHGGEFALQGQTYTLNVITGYGRPQVMVHQQQIVMHLPQDDANTIKTHLFAWYRHQATEYLTRQTHEMAAITGQSCQQIRVGDFKRQWGSCSREGIIRYHWPLIQALPQVIDYVVAHEVSHLTHMNHSQDFWHLVAQLCPDYKVQRKWLRDHGHVLKFCDD